MGTFIPYHRGGVHWTLGVVRANNTIDFYDSLGMLSKRNSGLSVCWFSPHFYSFFTYKLTCMQRINQIVEHDWKLLKRKEFGHYRYQLNIMNSMEIPMQGRVKNSFSFFFFSFYFSRMQLNAEFSFFFTHIPLLQNCPQSHFRCVIVLASAGKFSLNFWMTKSTKLLE